MKLYAQRFVHCCWFELWKDKNYFCRQVKIEIKPTKCLINFFVDILLNDKQLMLFIIANAMKLMRKFAKCSNINDRFIVVGRTFNSFCCLYILYCLFSNFYSTHDTLFSILRNAANDKCWTLFCLCTVYIKLLKAIVERSLQIEIMNHQMREEKEWKHYILYCIDYVM